ncbi:unnamed protein product [Brassica oleracea var. botrytis]
MRLAPRSERYNRIIFNFPHSGFGFGSEHHRQYIMLHQELVREFLKSSKKMVKDKDGEIHITHKTAHPFSEWKIVTLAEENGLCLTQEVEFSKWYFPGYSNKKGSRPRCNSSFPVGKSSTFIFKKRHREHDKLHQCYYRKRKGKPSHDEEKNDELDA